MRWRQEGPEALRTFSRRLLDRQLLKAMDVGRLDRGGQLQLLAKAQRLSTAAGLDPALCCALHQRQSQGYHPYKGGPEAVGWRITPGSGDQLQPGGQPD